VTFYFDAGAKRSKTLQIQGVSSRPFGGKGGGTNKKELGEKIVCVTTTEWRIGRLEEVWIYLARYWGNGKIVSNRKEKKKL